MWPLSPQTGGAGRFELGNAAKGPLQCSELGMPVVGLMFGDDLTESSPPVLELAVAADPYCGSYFQAQTDVAKASTRVTLRTTYLGSVVPLKEEQRTLALEFHREGPTDFAVLLPHHPRDRAGCAVDAGNSSGLLRLSIGKGRGMVQGPANLGRPYSGQTTRPGGGLPAWLVRLFPTIRLRSQHREVARGMDRLPGDQQGAHEPGRNAPAACSSPGSSASACCCIFPTAPTAIRARRNSARSMS